MQSVRPKKALGQHFLTDQNVAQAIVASLRSHGPVLEVGPGTGVLTQYLLQDPDIRLKVVEIDSESVRYLLEHFPRLAPALYEADFLKLDLAKLFPAEFALIGNFPYNISSQIFFKVLDCRMQIPEVVCMIQKEVAERLAAGPGSKTYGILSVLLQAWYDIEYQFTVGEGAFLPPPKVKSAVIRLTRNGRTSLDCDEDLFRKVVKTTFNQRRKTIRNSLKPILSTFPKLPDYIPYLDARPEQLSVEEFVELTKSLSL
ncbi:MAG: 16S rRNA (adenine(1518)-N(6)/adenine(1519)-N(6))-dimethyltransferase RsmA [Bacteroidales bacterium]|nr:16S rRNA (adenine(1518)-N(6)/adenine(1519)-N(6))-dimethyltransferase RsmA [Bacteroidales bacterium]